MKALNKAGDIARLGVHSLLAHKVRSVLTVVGIVFGVWSVIAMLAINEGASAESQRALRELGSDNIILTSAKPSDEESKASSAGGALAYGITRADVARLTANLPGIRTFAVVHQSQRTAHAGIRTMAATVIATEPSYAHVATIDLAAGRFLCDLDLLQQRPHCVQWPVSLGSASWCA